MQQVFAPLRPSPAPTRRSRTQGGQAMTEFLVLSAAIIPLFLLVPLLGKYQDIAHSAQMASRYIAFDAVNRDLDMPLATDAQRQAEVSRRYFGVRDAPISTIANSAGGNADDIGTDAGNPRWRDPQGALLIRSGADIALSYGTANAASQQDAYSAAADGKPFPGTGVIGLPARGIYRANVGVTLANVRQDSVFLQPFDRINLHIERQTSVLTDAWAANSSAQVVQRSARPVGVASGIGAMQTLLGTVVPMVDLGSVQAPQIGRLDLWRDLVPADRLRSRSAP